MPVIPFPPRRRPEPTAAAIIAAAEHALVDGRTHATCRRYGRAREQLEAHLHSLGEGMLLESGIAMLEVERGIEASGALLRVATGEDLLYALPSFIRLDRRHGLPILDARAQLRLAEECRRSVTAHGLVGNEHACALLEVDGALREARRLLRAR